MRMMYLSSARLCHKTQIGFRRPFYGSLHSDGDIAWKTGALWITKAAICYKIPFLYSDTDKLWKPPCSLPEKSPS